MTKLPIAVRKKTEADALEWAKSQLNKAADSDWGNMLTASTPHDYARKLLRDMATKSGNGAAAVAEIARGGYEVAHAVLIDIFTEQRERDITPFKSLEAYALSTMKPGFKFPKQDGKSRMDHTSRNAVIVATVYGVHRLFGLTVYSGDSSPKRGACKIVAAAIGMENHTIAEIYRTWAPVIMQSVQFDNVPEDPLRIIGMRLR